MVPLLCNWPCRQHLRPCIRTMVVAYVPNFFCLRLKFLYNVRIVVSFKVLVVYILVLEWNQAVRNEQDLESLNVKPKYKSMGSFWKYYSGQKIAPFPTIFIGGNHEASNYLWEL